MPALRRSKRATAGSLTHNIPISRFPHDAIGSEREYLASALPAKSARFPGSPPQPAGKNSGVFILTSGLPSVNKNAPAPPFRLTDLPDRLRRSRSAPNLFPAPEHKNAGLTFSVRPAPFLKAYFFRMKSVPTSARRTSGTMMLPSACWYCSRMAGSTRLVARPDAFSVWTRRIFPSASRNRTLPRRA